MLKISIVFIGYQSWLVLGHQCGEHVKHCQDRRQF